MTQSGCRWNKALLGWMYTGWFSTKVLYPSWGSFLAAWKKKPAVIAFLIFVKFFPAETTSSLYLHRQQQRSLAYNLVKEKVTTNRSNYNNCSANKNYKHLERWIWCTERAIASIGSTQQNSIPRHWLNVHMLSISHHCTLAKLFIFRDKIACRILSTYSNIPETRLIQISWPLPLPYHL